MRNLTHLPVAEGYSERGEPDAPIYYVSSVVLNHPEAEVEDVQAVPLNPYGSTGIEGRGLLYKWGVNETVDVIVVRESSTSEREFLLGEKPNGNLQFIGGFINEGETVEVAGSRELQEETLIDVSQDRLKRIGRLPVLDARVTDNAWIETEVATVQLRDAEWDNAEGKTDIVNIHWVPEDEIWENLKEMHHPLLELYYAMNDTE